MADTCSIYCINLIKAVEYAGSRGQRSMDQGRKCHIISIIIVVVVVITTQEVLHLIRFASPRASYLE